MQLVIFKSDVSENKKKILLYLTKVDWDQSYLT